MDPICRVTTPCIKMVCDINQVFPFFVMKKSEARSIINARWNRCAWNPKYKAYKDFFESSYQPYAQMALYYESNDEFIPRFSKFLSYEEIEDYIKKWFSIYYSPNPYSKARENDIKPVVISKYINNYLINNGGSCSFTECLESMFGTDVGNPDILKSVINYFSPFNVTEDTISFKEGEESNSLYNEADLYVECDSDDKEFFFNYFDSIYQHSVKCQGVTLNKPIASTQSLLSYLTAIRTKPFILLAGISGTGKSRIVRKLAQATDTIGNYADDAARFACHSPENFCLIQVKPNWHNSMDVVGFKSNIGKDGEHYEFTPFVEFIAKAWRHPNVPFFLCLDEMNLAPVEEYFAEFLSAIESRSIDAEGNYETDPIIKPFEEYGKDVCKQMITHLLGTEPDATLTERFKTKGLTLPQNLIVMGTVNMDETTFSFSRKVLDRAMSIEMNEVDYDAFLDGSTEMDVPVLVENNALLIKRFIKAQDVKDKIDAQAVKNFLNDVNNVLEGTPFKLGYRAANEAMLYVSAAKDFGNDNLASALDEFTLMKILSRIEGDDTKLRTMMGEDILQELNRLFSTGMFSGMESSKTLAKLNQMIKSLERDHFVSFWG